MRGIRTREFLWSAQLISCGSSSQKIPGGLSGSLRAEDLREMGPILRMCWAQSSLCVER